MNKYFIIFVFLVSQTIFAGTLIFKDGTKLSGIEIVSINDGEIIIEKDKAKRTYSIKKIKSYYGTDLDDSSDEIPGEFSDYSVKILDVKIPNEGVDSKKKAEDAEIEYSIQKKGKSPRIKVPYFYLYIITPGKNEVSGRQVHRYFYPKQAKPKGKDYDEAAIMAELNDFGRPNWNTHYRNIKGKLQGNKITFSLKGIGKRKILAWHLEVWGNDSKIVDKTENMMHFFGSKVHKNWWKRYGF